ALVLVMLLPTGWGSAVAAPMASVFVTNDPAHPVPVAPVAITGGGSYISFGAGQFDVPCGYNGPCTASAISISMSSGVSSMDLKYQGSFVATFLGPAYNPPGTHNVQLALTRPIRFTTISCSGPNTDDCAVSWIGAEP